MKGLTLIKNSDHKEIHLKKKNLTINVYKNGLIKIKQTAPIARTDYIEITNSGEFNVTSETDWGVV